MDTNLPNLTGSSVTNQPPTPVPTPQDLKVETTLPVSNSTEPTTTTQPSVITKKKSNKKFIIILSAILFVIMLIPTLVGIAYILFTTFNTPKLVKAQIEVLHPVYQEYNANIEKLAVDILSDGDPTASTDSIERDIQKSKNIYDLAIKSKEDLEKFLGASSIYETEKYKQLITDYISKTNSILVLSNELNNYNSQFLPIRKEYEEITKDAGTLSSYMFTDPEKYITDVKALATEEKNLIQKVRKIKPSQKLSLIHESYIDIFQSEVDFLETIQLDVFNRDVKGLQNNMLQFQQDTKALSDKNQALIDKIQEEIQYDYDKSKTIKQNVDSEYSFLRSKYYR